MRFRALSLSLLMAGLAAPGLQADASQTSRVEQFDYRWTLAGFKGTLARVFVPGQGEGKLTTERVPQNESGETIRTELLISSRDGESSEYWLYGAEIDARERRTVRSWSSQRFRGKSREKEREAEDVDALDLASSIYYLRRERPALASEEVVWSSGRLNAVMIRPGPTGTARWRGRDVATRSYSIRGLPKPGRETWSGKMDLLITDDEQAVPLEIAVVRNGLRVRLELVDVAE